ncbi:SRPBCC family protein [uncultured Albimonas sp.]|uniref:SRPBCC family protein n=1 Tax=uncultured Albimonas sp. TaxID=1331701 RepID=UPI0030ECC2F8
MSRSDLPHPLARLRAGAASGAALDPRSRRRGESLRAGASAAVVGLGIGAALFAGWRAARALQAADLRHPPDDAPGRAARRGRFGDWEVAGRTVTIDRPREEVYRFWRDVANLPRFMEHVVHAHEVDGTVRWALAGPEGRTLAVVAELVSDRPGDEIAWASTEASEIETRGKVRFRDAPAGRGTEVQAVVAYIPPGGRLGSWIRMLYGRDPALQGRRELKRLKMLLETGEIASSRSRPH